MKRRSISLYGLEPARLPFFAVVSRLSAAAPSTKSKSSDEAAPTTVNNYQTELDAEWTDPGRSSRPAPTSAEIFNNKIRDKFITIGEPIVSAQSTVEFLDTKQDDDSIAVFARGSTTFIYGGKHGNSPRTQ
ncbi:hypothetical protein [Actinomyces israelii]|uniref:hypothetical protein n=1 Tax=Actinomyces israelii TaxID=1659 RepID=UPI002555C6A8|nr:hypothetical protein [Actinomyces israelii]